MEADKISVIVPVYNVKPYLQRCIDSILNQTYTNLEIICVDDGSTDGSTEILDGYMSHDPRVKIIHQKNTGTSGARNAGLDAVTGDWVTFVDSDDWLEKDMYKYLLSDPKVENADIRACGYFFSYPDGEVEVKNRLPVPEGAQKMESFLYYIYRRDDYKAVGSYIVNKLFRAEWFNGTTARLRFDDSLGSLGEDIELAARCYLLADTISYLPEAKYHYTQRDDSSFVKALDKRLETLQHIRAYEMILALYEQNNISEKVIDQVRRFYVYHLGLLMDYAIQTKNTEKQGILKEKATPYLDIYIRTNQEHPDRIIWIQGLFGEKNGEY